MTGPEHYREAERLLELGIRPYTTMGIDRSAVEAHERDLTKAREAAQVHATLALAAATALVDPRPWREVIDGPVSKP